MSISSRRKQQIELASFHSAFLADDTLVQIVPSFDYPNRIPLMSSASSVGPFKAGISAFVPLWFAMLLQQKSLCTLQVPDWLQTDHLTKVKRFETTENGLTPSEHLEEEEDVEEEEATLPFYYYELGQRFTSTKTNGASQTTTTTAMAQPQRASNLVLQDIAQIRLDKIRQQFQKLSREQMSNPYLCVSITGIASAELVQMKALIQQALNDQRFLATGAAMERKEQQQQKTKGGVGRKVVEGGASDDEEEGATARPLNTLRSRTRRFRR